MAEPHWAEYAATGQARGLTAVLPHRPRGSPQPSFPRVLGSPSSAGPGSAQQPQHANVTPSGSWAQTSSRPSTSGGLRYSHSLHDGRARRTVACSSCGGPAAPARSPSTRELVGAAVLNEFVRSPAAQAGLMRDQVASWMRGWDDEVGSYASVSVFAQLKLNELQTMTRALPRPHPVHTAAVCHVFERCAGLFGRYESLIRPLWREVLGCVYADAHTLELDGRPLGACDRHLALEPWFARYERAAQRCALLEEQLERGARDVAHAHESALARDAQLASAIGGWQRELVRVKALSERDGGEAARVALPVLEAQVGELAQLLAFTQRELRSREDELRVALRANAELRAPRARAARPAAAELERRGGGSDGGVGEPRELVEQIRARFRALPALAQGMLAHELLLAAPEMSLALAALLVRPPRFGWWAEFADAEHEVAYREAEVHHTLCARTLIVCAADTLLFGGSFVARIAETGGSLDGFGLVALAMFGLYALVSGVTYAALRRRARLVVAELAFGAVLVATPTASTFFTHDPAREQAAVHLDAPLWFPSSHAAVHMILLSRFMFVGVFTPTRPRLFAAVLALNWLAFLCGDVLVSDLRLQEVLMLLLAVLVMSTLLVAVNLQLALIHRGRYWFIRESALALVERERLIRDETRTALRLAAVAEERRARSKLIRMVMHDLRSPLLSISNIAAVLARMDTSTPLSEPIVAKCCTSLGTCAALTQSIISDMLDFERIDSGRLVLLPAPFRVRDLLAASQATFEGVAKTRGISLVFEELPTALSERLFVGDVRRLQQCLNNGVSNALKFSDAGGTVHVRAELPAAPPAQSEAATRPSSRAIAEPVGAAQALGGRLSHHARRLMPALSDAARTASVSDAGTDGALIASPAWGALEPAKVAPAPAEEGRRTPLRVSVRDWGVGLSREDLEQLREGAAFSQVGRGKEQGSSGTGLGLTIARQILAMHGSTLGIESGGHGKGTRYTMELLLPEPPAGDGASHAHDARHDARDCLSVNDSAGARGEGGVPALTPRSARHDSAPTLGLSSPVLAQSGRGAQPLRVLYADDDEFLQLTVPLRVFAPLGVPYDTAENGALAVELVTRAGAMHYDLVVMDNQMPGMSGSDATRALRSRGYRGTIVGMTGDLVGSDERNNFEAAGLDACVGKDTDGIETLIAMVAARMATTIHGLGAHDDVVIEVEDSQRGCQRSPS